MKYLIFSDLHGSSVYSHKLIEIFEREKCDYMLCLGDILYHGPRNDLPIGYNPKEVIKDLNKYASRIIAIKGNCEAYVDQMVLDFIIHDEYELSYNGKRIIMTHGHIINPTNHLNIESGVVLYGHTHIYGVDKINDVLYINPGSTTIPKNGCKNSFAILENNEITIYDFDLNVIFRQII
ncbi:MAG: phosphodiesterase [Anaeroplasmataceae bacterium]